MRLPALALTDRVNLFALVNSPAAEKAGIKPIAGGDLWIIDGNETTSQLTCSAATWRATSLSRAWYPAPGRTLATVICVAINCAWLRPGS